MNKLSKWPLYEKEELEKVSSIINSGNVNYWTGQEGKQFEKEFAKWNKTKFSIAISNGSLALLAGYQALGIQEGDEVITTPRTFIATSTSIKLLKANPIFADVDRETGLINAASIEPLITRKTKAISVVHLGGWPAEMQEICKLAKNYGLYVLEDCAQAHGAQLIINNKSKNVGSFGDIGAWSFCQEKIISTLGEGGMITTNSESIWKNIFSFKDHGKNFLNLEKTKDELGFKYLHDNLGTNLRLTEVQSAVGRIQLEKLSSFRKKREENALKIFKEISELSCIRVPMPPQNIVHAWYRLYGYIINDALKSDWSRDRILYEISSAGYPALTGSCGQIYLEKCMKNKLYDDIFFLKNAKELSNTSLAFLVHPTIAVKELDEYAETIKSILKKAMR